MADEEELDTYMMADTIIDLAKAQFDIIKPSPEMNNKEIADIMKYLASGAPDTMWFEEKPIFGRIGISLMLSLTLYEFPKFYQEHELSQYN